MSRHSVIAFAFTDCTQKTATTRCAKCKICGKVIADGISTTSNFLRHIKTHTVQYKDFLKQSEQASSSQTQSQTKLSDFGLRGEAYHFDHQKQQRIVSAVVKNLIIGCSLPLTIVENEQFSCFCQVLDPQARDISSSEVVTELNELYSFVQNHVLDLMQEAERIALTLDIWSDRGMRGCLGVTVTAHILVNYTLVSKLLSCDFCDNGKHTGENIVAAFEAVCTAYNIKEKVPYVINDNASNMRKAFTVAFDTGDQSVDIPTDEAGAQEQKQEDVENADFWEDVDADVRNVIDRVVRSKRLNCFAHTLQLTVADGLKEAKMHTALAKVSETCTLLHNNASFRIAFDKFFGAHAIIPQVNDTRWNSTLKQIDAYLSLQKERFDEMLEEVNQPHLELTQIQYNQCQELKDILQPFLDATNKVQGDQNVTVSSVVPAVIGLHRHLTVLAPSYCTQLVTALKVSLETRFSGVCVRAGLTICESSDISHLPFSDSLYFQAAVLDPNFCLQWLRKVPSKNVDVLKAEIVAGLKTFSSSLPVVPRMNDCNVYSSVPTKKAKYTSSLFTYDGDESDADSQSGPDPITFEVEFNQYQELASKARRSINRNNEEINIMSFWKVHETSLPLLNKVALNLFYIPGSSAPVEKVFSQGGILMYPQQARLDDSLLEKLVFLKCNK